MSRKPVQLPLRHRSGHRSGVVAALLSGAPGLLASAWVGAAEQGGAPARNDALVSAGAMLQMLTALLVVVLVIIGLAVLVRRLSLVPGSSSGAIRIVGSLALNSKDRLLLVQVGEEQILVSASPGRVDKVHRLQSPIDPERYQTARQGDGRNFASLLNQAMGRQS